MMGGAVAKERIEYDYETLATSIQLLQDHADTSSSLRKSMKLFSGNQSFVRCCGSTLEERKEAREDNILPTGALFTSEGIMGRTMSSGSSSRRRKQSRSNSSSSSLIHIKFCFCFCFWFVDRLGAGRLEGFERPSRRASASERLDLRALVEMEEVVVVEKRLGSL